MDGEPYWIIPSPLILATEKHMSLFEGLIGPVAKIIDKIIPDPDARDKAKLELLKLEGSQEMEAMKTQLSAILAERSEEHTSELQSLMRISYAVFCLKKKKKKDKARIIEHPISIYTPNNYIKNK